MYPCLILVEHSLRLRKEQLMRRREVTSSNHNDPSPLRQSRVLSLDPMIMGTPASILLYNFLRFLRERLRSEQVFRTNRNDIKHPLHPHIFMDHRCLGTALHSKTLFHILEIAVSTHTVNYIRAIATTLVRSVIVQLSTFHFTPILLIK